MLPWQAVLPSLGVYAFSSCLIYNQTHRQNLALYLLDKHYRNGAMRVGGVDDGVGGGSARSQVEADLETGAALTQQYSQQNSGQATEAATYANEMRHMIANVAHDLKTPLTSFLSGIDFMSHLLDECEEVLEEHLPGGEGRALYEEHLVPMRSCLAGVHNTNAFMIMTINRCIDYTKASKGMKLSPKPETFDLQEALKLPLHVMRNLQQRLTITLHDEPICALDSAICSHIITDKQWLQENLLCLLSNAVKYSSRGEVDIFINLVPERLVRPTVVGASTASKQQQQQQRDKSRARGTGSGSPESRMARLISTPTGMLSGSSMFAARYAPAPPPLATHPTAAVPQLIGDEQGQEQDHTASVGRSHSVEIQPSDRDAGWISTTAPAASTAGSGSAAAVGGSGGDFIGETGEDVSPSVRLTALGLVRVLNFVGYGSARGMSSMSNKSGRSMRGCPEGGCSGGQQQQQRQQRHSSKVSTESTFSLEVGSNLEFDQRIRQTNSTSASASASASASTSSASKDDGNACGGVIVGEVNHVPFADADALDAFEYSRASSLDEVSPFQLLRKNAPAVGKGAGGGNGAAAKKSDNGNSSDHNVSPAFSATHGITNTTLDKTAEDTAGALVDLEAPLELPDDLSGIEEESEKLEDYAAKSPASVYLPGEGSGIAATPRSGVSLKVVPTGEDLSAAPISTATAPHMSDSAAPINTATAPHMSDAGVEAGSAHTPRDSKDEQQVLLVEVQDTGIGLSAEAMDNLFNPFRQAQRLAGGTGLGLYSLAKRMDALGGHYGVKKRPDGKRGSVFWFAVPYRPDQVSALMNLRTRKHQHRHHVDKGTTVTSTTRRASSPKRTMPPRPSSRQDAPAGSSAAGHRCKLGVVEADSRGFWCSSSGSGSGSSHGSPIRSSPGVASVAGVVSVKPIRFLQAGEKRSSRSSDSSFQSFCSADGGTGGISGGGMGQPSPSRLSILLADDSIAIVKMTSMMLRRQGHRVTSAENGVEALEMLLEHYRLRSQQSSTATAVTGAAALSISPAFDVVLMDLQMPVMDGLEAVRRLRAEEARLARNSAIVIVRQLVVGCSANSDAETRQEALLAGVDAFMAKPFTMETFSDILWQLKNNTADKHSL